MSGKRREMHFGVFVLGTGNHSAQSAAARCLQNSCQPLRAHGPRQRHRAFAYFASDFRPKTIGGDCRRTGRRLDEGDSAPK